MIFICFITTILELMLDLLISSCEWAGPGRSEHVLPIPNPILAGLLNHCPSPAHLAQFFLKALYFWAWAGRVPILTSSIERPIYMQASILKEMH